MRVNIIPNIRVALTYALVFTFAMYGWHAIATVMPNSLITPDSNWIWETFIIVSVWTIISMFQNNTSLAGRLLWGVMCSATVALIALNIKTGWVGIINQLLMRLPIIGNTLESMEILMEIPKVMEQYIIVLVMGKLSGIIQIELPKVQFLSGPIHPFDDGWRQY